MGKIYLVDSENVGDIWVPLLVSSQEDDEVLVFYTTKSPHMNYENVKQCAGFPAGIGTWLSPEPERGQGVCHCIK